MRKVYIAVIALLLVGSLSAQAQIKLGVKAGANFPSLEDTGGNFAIHNNTGWHAGGMLEIKIPLIGIEADVLYSQTGADIPGYGELKNTTLDIPILAKLYILKIFNIHAGPQFTFLTSSKLDDVSIKDDIENSNFRFVAGLGVALGPLDVHGRFIFPSNSTISTVPADLQHSNIQLSVGWWLKK